jgi:hypothetical protein
MKLLDGRASGFSENPYDFTAEGGRRGISRKVSVADGDEADKVKIPETMWDSMPAAARSFFFTLGNDGFGAKVTAMIHGGDGVKGFGCKGLRVVAPDGEVICDTLPEHISALV